MDLICFLCLTEKTQKKRYSPFSGDILFTPLMKKIPGLCIYITIVRFSLSSTSTVSSVLDLTPDIQTWLVRDFLFFLPSLLLLLPLSSLLCLLSFLSSFFIICCFSHSHSSSFSCHFDRRQHQKVWMSPNFLWVYGGTRTGDLHWKIIL